MKSFYKRCQIKVTAVYISPAETMLTPHVEIRCENITVPNCLTTKETFRSAREAELFGAQMARKWIDENTK